MILKKILQENQYTIQKLLKYFFLIIFIGFNCQLKSQEMTSFISDSKTINIKDFDKKINLMINELGVPGVSLAIIENNQIVYSNFYGKKNLKGNKNIDKNTVFEAASLTKMYLVYVAQRLIEDKILDLDKPLYQYLEYEPLQHDPRYKNITTRMILSHTSGIENWSWNNKKDVLEIVSNPGEQFVYSGEGFQYLAKVIEKILKEPYESYVKRMVITPFELKNTYLKYRKAKSSLKESPSDYAIGYTQMRDEVEKWKNYETVPASGAHTTGKDYARFIISMFDKKNLSNERIQDMIKPIKVLGDDESTGYMGEGFFTIPSKKDTVVSFSGNNDGFRSELFYSVSHGRGFVFFTNSDQGKLITKEINEMTCHFNVEFLFQDNFFKYYPSSSISLQKIYRDKGIKGLEKGIEDFKKEGKLDENTLNELAEIYKEKEPDLPLKLLNSNISVFPKSANSYALLGRIYLDKKQYKEALSSFTKAKELGFGLWNLDDDIKNCEENIYKKTF